MILKESPTVTFIGAGNLATQLALCLHKSGIKIIQVFSRTEEAASLLAMKVGALS
ncbi:MAG: NAD(P)-binding domain-containing protein, partial [Bacteroidales bacterium]|nr:NAD(P)-binding domain-containing protein [Bacteroidales bacterium]